MTAGDAVLSTPRIPHGAVALRLHLFERPGVEVLHSLRPPWPRWVQRLYELEEAGEEGIDLERGEVTMGAALSATADRLKHRLDLLAWGVTALEELHWCCELHGDDIIAWRITARAAALEELDEAGVEGPLCSVCELDERGRVRLFDGWEL